MTVVLDLRAVERTYRSPAGEVAAVRGIDLTVSAGELIVVVGPSGSGKSTLLHLAIGWEAPDVGTVERSAEVSRASGWGGIALVPQDLGLLDELTAGQNIEIAAELAGATAPIDVVSPATALGFDHLLHRRPAELSLGEQQRVAVARALVASPRLLVADEPTAHQDETNAMRIMAMLADTAARGTAVLVATHDARVVESADRVVEIVDGRLARRASDPAGPVSD